MAVDFYLPNDDIRELLKSCNDAIEQYTMKCEALVMRPKSRDVARVLAQNAQTWETISKVGSQCKFHQTDIFQVDDGTVIDFNLINVFLDSADDCSTHLRRYQIRYH